MVQMKSGWEFVNLTQCLDHLQADGRIANYHTCPLLPEVEPAHAHVSAACPPVFDDFLCWPAAPAHSVVQQPCPGNYKQLNHKSKKIVDILLQIFLQIYSLDTYSKHHIHILQQSISLITITRTPTTFLHKCKKRLKMACF